MFILKRRFIAIVAFIYWTYEFPHVGYILINKVVLELRSLTYFWNEWPYLLLLQKISKLNALLFWHLSWKLKNKRVFPYNYVVCEVQKVAAVPNREDIEFASLVWSACRVLTDALRLVPICFGLFPTISKTVIFMLVGRNGYCFCMVWTIY